MHIIPRKVFIKKQVSVIEYLRIEHIHPYKRKNLVNRMKKILLLATGGTIASLGTENGLAPAIIAQDLIKYIPALQERFELSALQVCNLDSTNMTPKHWSLLAETIEKHYDAYDGFVICHGTDTMAYTAAALSYMIQNSNKPIVITGSQRPINQEDTDAKINLRDSILYAGDFSSSGVVLVFGGNVIAGTRAKKTRAHSFNAFSSVNFPTIAVVRNERIIRYLPAEVFQKPVRFATKLNDRVVLLKLIPGMRPELVSYLFQHYDCLIVESFGVGGIPITLMEVFYREMRQWIAKGKIVVMATQVVNEGSNMEIYEVGRRVKKDFDLIEAYDMTLEATVTKMMYLLANCGRNYQSVRDGFYRTVNHDILIASSL